MTAAEADLFSRVLGEELRKARMANCLTRPQLLARLRDEISTQTLTTYELGTRHIGVRRLYDLCRAMDVQAHDVLARVHTRIAGPDGRGGVVVDLNRVVHLRQTELLPLRRWAAERLNQLGSAEVLLDTPALDRLAELCGLETAALVGLLRDLVSVVTCVAG